MQTKLHSSGITFAIDEVTPCTTPLPLRRSHEALKSWLGDIESCHDYHGEIVRDVEYQPLLAAVYLAFSQHRPLVLSPDAVWITISQGVAHHMMLNAERLRSRFVSHQGKLNLVFVCKGWVEKSPENPWPEAFTGWSEMIRHFVGPQIHDALVCDFSTTGPTERAVSQIVMMDIFQRYFHYIAYCICGIPSVTLEGSTADWERLAQKVAALRIFDMDWWLDHLEPICQQFVRASRGDVDLKHWQNICKLREAYGGDIINGWIAKLFPYLLAYYKGPCNRRNPIFETGEGFTTLNAPSGVSRVPFTWINGQARTSRAMEVIGGLIGVEQDARTFALRPKVGWAIRVADSFDVLLARVSNEHTTFDGASMPEEGAVHEYCAELAHFYHRSNGAEFFGKGDAAFCRILPFDQLRPVLSGDTLWHRLGALRDGSTIEIQLNWSSARNSLKDRKDLSGQLAELKMHLAPVRVTSKSLFGVIQHQSIIALSFGEFLQLLLESKGDVHKLAARSHKYG